MLKKAKAVGDLLRLKIKSLTTSGTHEIKRNAEMQFWLQMKLREGAELQKSHYEYFYTTHFDLVPDYYTEKEILDIGCGPRGSLEWCDQASRRVGVDPLAESYRQVLGADGHSMEYVESGAEDLPFADSSFDIVASFNSLDHVDSLEQTIKELKRVTRSDGDLLLITDVNHKPTTKEPISFSWDITEEFEPEFIVVDEQHFEKTNPGIYTSITRDIPYTHHDHDEESLSEAGIPYDHSDPSSRYGILTAHFRRR